MIMTMAESSASPVSAPLAPASMAPPSARYAHGIATTGAARWVHTSGVVPIAADGSTPAGLAEQAALIWSNIAAILAEAGMDNRNIVSITTYAVAAELDTSEGLAPVMAARDAFLDGHLVASTLVTVPALAKPEWRMEIAVVAAA